MLTFIFFLRPRYSISLGLKYKTQNIYVWNGHGVDSEIVNVSPRHAALNRWTATDKRWNKKVVSRGSVVASALTLALFEALIRRQTIDKVGQLLGRGLVSKDNRPMKCTTSKVLTCRVTNGGPIWSGFMLFYSQKIKQHKSVGVLIV